MTGTNAEIYEFPITPTQASLWFIHQMDPTGSAYNVPGSFEIEGRLDAEALRASFEDLIRRHEILRTLFVSRDGNVLQRVLPHLDMDWEHHHEGPGANRADLIALAETEVRRPFDLVNGPLLRVRLWSFGSERHLLTFVFHHIVIDHQSFEQFSQELTRIYRERTKGADATLPELELQFADYSLWLLENALPAAKAVGLPAFVEHLDDFSGSLDLPLDGPRSDTTAAGHEFRFGLSATLSERLREFARNEGLSLFNVTLGVLQVLLHHYCAQDDVIVGTPFANRGEDERLDSVLGCFINTLPIGVRIEPDSDFRSLLSSARSALLSAHEHQAVPFDAIVNALMPRRELGLNPLYQVGFVFQEPPIAIELEGVRATDLAVHSGGAMYDLHFWLWEVEGTIQGTIWYDASLFTEDKIVRLTERYSALAERLLEAPDAPIGDMSVATSRDHSLERDVNATAREWSGPETVLGLIEAQAERTPTRPAVITSSGSLTYAELTARAAALAERLTADSVCRGDLVGVYLERGPDLIPALLAVQMVGAAYVPLDPDYPASRLEYIATQAGLRALVADQEATFVLPEACATVAIHDVEVDSAHTRSVPPSQPTRDSTMYVIFTSGSTGRPKGVSVPQRCAVNLLRSMAEVNGLGDAPRLLAVTTLSFDIAVLELFLPLTSGGVVVMTDADQALDGSVLIELLAEHRVTAMQATPSTWRLMLDAGWDGSTDLTALCGGEALPPDLAAALTDRVGALWNVYGPTETTVWSTHDLVTTRDVTIGKPIANTTCHVVSSRGVALPSDVVGELYIGGAGVADGYHGRPDLTAERFIENPFGDGRLYRTGDLVRRLADGRLRYLGRTDDQVKVNGFRIELGEVERALASHPAVRQAVAAVQRLADGNARVVAFVVPAEGAQVVGSEIRRHARHLLPDYMIPGMIHERDAVPLTPNGKIDRKALLADSLDAMTRPSAEPPRTPAEQIIADIWAEALGVPAVSRHDNFFELGGHSLLAIRVTTEMRSRLDAHLDPRSLFFSSVAQLAQVVQ